MMDMKAFWKIMNESGKLLIVTSVISSIGGVGLESINEKLVVLIPFLILVPAMNNMVGGFGTVISSRISTMLYMGELKGSNIFKSHKAGNLFILFSIISFISAVYISALASIASVLKGFDLTLVFVAKLLVVTVMITAILAVFIFWLSATAGVYIFKKDKNPDNFLIPLTTSVADLGSMLLMSGMIVWLF
ncbi:MAG: magnesium transporter [Candidatus Woesearchaeota archaeon]